MVSRYAIHDGSGWTLRLVLRQAAQTAEPERPESVHKQTGNSWLPAVLKALDVFPEAQTLVRNTILRLCGHTVHEDSS